jgi:hypothetical protein
MAAEEPDAEPVPKLPRGRGIRLSGPEIFRVLLTLGMLVAIVVLAKPCSEAVSSFVMRFDKGSNQGSAMPKPDRVAPPQPTEGVLIRSDMSDDEKKAAIEHERARAAAAAGSARH